MSFVKLRCERAYATGALRTPLSLREFAAKMRRIGVSATVDGGRLTLVCAGETWVFSDWRQNGLEQVGWLTISTDGFIGNLSEKLAGAGVRHRFEHSRPLDLETDDVRCVTSFDYLWADHTLRPGGKKADVETYDEPVDAVAAAAYAARQAAQAAATPKT